MYLQLVVLNVKSDFVWILFQIPSEVEKLFNDPCAINLSPEVNWSTWKFPTYDVHVYSHHNSCTIDYAIGKHSVFFVIDLTPDVPTCNPEYKGCLCQILNLKKIAWYSSSI